MMQNEKAIWQKEHKAVGPERYVIVPENHLGQAYLEHSKVFYLYRTVDGAEDAIRRFKLNDMKVMQSACLGDIAFPQPGMLLAGTWSGRCCKVTTVDDAGFEVLCYDTLVTGVRNLDELKARLTENPKNKEFRFTKDMARKYHVISKGDS